MANTMNRVIITPQQIPNDIQPIAIKIVSFDKDEDDGFDTGSTTDTASSVGDSEGDGVVGSGGISKIGAGVVGG